jgi:hypothetical protein
MDGVREEERWTGMADVGEEENARDGGEWRLLHGTAARLARAAASGTRQQVVGIKMGEKKKTCSISLLCGQGRIRESDARTCEAVRVDLKLA